MLRLAIPLTDIEASPDLGLQSFMLVGPSHSFLMKCHEGFRGSINEGTTDGLIRRANQPRQFALCNRYANPHDDTGLVFGAGVTLRRAHQRITFEVRHTKGLTDLRAGPRPPDCSRCTLTNRVTSILIGANLRR